MRLPSRYPHQRFDGRAARGSQHRNNSSLFAFRTTRLRANLTDLNASLALVFHSFRRRRLSPALLLVLGKRSAPTFNWLAHRDLLRFTAFFAVTTEAPPRPRGRQGRIPEHAYRPELATVTLCLHREASPFWIILLLVLADPEHLELLTLNQRVLLRPPKSLVRQG